jgi:hypothetical protein
MIIRHSPMELRASAGLMTPYLARLTISGRSPEPKHNVRDGPLVVVSSSVPGARQSGVHSDNTPPVDIAEERTSPSDKEVCNATTSHAWPIQYDTVFLEPECQPTNPVCGIVPQSASTSFSRSLRTHIRLTSYRGDAESTPHS